MSKRYEVYYTYSVDASVRIDADSEEEAVEKIEKLWEQEDTSVILRPKTLEYTDFEVLYAKKR